MMLEPATISLIGNIDEFRISDFGFRIGSFQIRNPQSAIRNLIGMTLVEILVVLAIIGMLFGMGLPAMMQYAKRMRFQATTRQLMGLISLARSTAISQHEDYAVVVDQDQRVVRVLGAGSSEPLEHVVRIPSSIGIELLVGGEPSEESRFTFTSSGSLTGRSVAVKLTDQQKSQTITVTSATGALTVQ